MTCRAGWPCVVGVGDRWSLFDPRFISDPRFLLYLPSLTLLSLTPPDPLPPGSLVGSSPWLALLALFSLTPLLTLFPLARLLAPSSPCPLTLLSLTRSLTLLSLALPLTLLPVSS